MQDILSFTKLIGKSKKIKRTGWVREGINSPESVAEHCFRLSVLAMILADSLGVDQSKLIKMAIVHDIGEIKTGDIVVDRWGKTDSEARKKKESMEKKAIEEIFAHAKELEDYPAIFQEMIERKTKEALMFKQLDKLEMAIQALEYEKEQGKNMEEFFVDAATYITHPILKKIMNDILQERKT